MGKDEEKVAMMVEKADTSRDGLQLSTHAQQFAGSKVDKTKDAMPMPKPRKKPS